MQRFAWDRLMRATRVVAAMALGLSIGVQSHAWDGERMLAAAQRLGPRATAGVRLLQPLLTSSAGLDDEGKLVAINRFFNKRIAYGDDMAVWGQVDYWASPLETLFSGKGDCEDYVIAKYFSLLAAGMPASKLRLVYVRATLGEDENKATVAHMVLAYYADPNATPLILDNLTSDILPATRRNDLTPVFSFNSEGLWQGIGGGPSSDPLSRLSRWREVMAKAHDEGFP